MEKNGHTDFEIVSKYAEGPYAVVMSAYRAPDGRTIALKLFGYKPECPKVDWILCEAEFLKSLRGLGGSLQIAAVFNDTKTGILTNKLYKTHRMQYPVIVMERLTGGSLQALLQQKADQGRWLSEKEIAVIFKHIIVALHEVHVTANLIHCNLKPLNVYFVTANDSTYRLKLVDFGFSVALHDRDEHYSYGSQTSNRLITEFAVDYLAPETLEEYFVSQGTVFSRKTGQLSDPLCFEMLIKLLI